MIQYAELGDYAEIHNIINNKKTKDELETLQKEFDNLQDNFQEQEQPTEIFNTISKLIQDKKNILSQSGGSKNFLKNDYEQKYLKYKLKYFKLKNMI